MNFKITREALLKPLQLVCGVVERRQSLPILSHVLLVLDDGRLSLTATDLEVEMVVHTQTEGGEDGEITLPAKKFLDICRTLPDEAVLDVTVKGERATVRAGRSRFTLATMPAADFPNIDEVKDAERIEVQEADLKALIEKTKFSMAQQDVRYYLNGLLFEISGDMLRSVATDGHRLALCERANASGFNDTRQVIIPRKGVLELERLLEDDQSSLMLDLGSNHVKVTKGEFVFTSKLIDGRFPDYQRVVPTGGNKTLVGEVDSLKKALTRASILSNEKYRGIRLQMADNNLKIFANNPEQEEAEEEIGVEFEGDPLEIGFNVNYLIEALNALGTEKATITLSDSNSSCIIEGGDQGCRYVVMPMRL